MVAVAVGPAAVAVVQIAEEAALLPQVQAEEWSVPVLVVVVVLVLVLVLVAADADDTSGFLVLHGSEPVDVDRLHR